MKDVKEKVALVTGSTDGLGSGTALALARMGASVLLHGRDQAKLEKMANRLEGSTGSDRIGTYLADFSSLAEVRRLAAEIEENTDHLDLLINNAGIGFGDPAAGRELSKDGYELRFSVNYLAPFLLTNLLIPCLRHSAPSRIVNVASIGQETIDFNNVMLAKGYTGIHAYRQSKTALVMFTFDLAERLKKTATTVNCLHPATFMDTKLTREAKIGPRSSIQSGIYTVMYVATSPELDGKTSRFFDQKEESRAIDQAYDMDARNQLRELSEKLTGVGLPPLVMGDEVRSL
jgi:NAD(P)-dependent dehydrogenase (short-subunit alcohol dehydrogenase family)